MLNMVSFDREEQLRRLHEQRKQATKDKVEEAIKRLTKSSKAINFNSVAQKAGVSKARFTIIQSLKNVSISCEINKKKHL